MKNCITRDNCFSLQNFLIATFSYFWGLSEAPLWHQSQTKSQDIWIPNNRLSAAKITFLCNIIRGVCSFKTGMVCQQNVFRLWKKLWDVVARPRDLAPTALPRKLTKDSKNHCHCAKKKLTWNSYTKQGGRSCAKPRRAFIEKFGLGQKF